MFPRYWWEAIQWCRPSPTGSFSVCVGNNIFWNEVPYLFHDHNCYNRTYLLFTTCPLLWHKRKNNIWYIYVLKFLLPCIVILCYIVCGTRIHPGKWSVVPVLLLKHLVYCINTKRQNNLVPLCTSFVNRLSDLYKDFNNGRTSTRCTINNIRILCSLFDLRDRVKVIYILVYYEWLV